MNKIYIYGFTGGRNEWIPIKAFKTKEAAEKEMRDSRTKAGKDYPYYMRPRVVEMPFEDK